MNRQELIIKSVSEVYGLSESEIHSETRKQPMKEARQMAMYMIHKDDVSLTWKFVGECFMPARDHATVIHAVKTIQNLIDTEEAMRLRYERSLCCIISKPTMPTEDILTSKLQELNKWLNDPENANHKCRLEVQIEYNVYNNLLFKNATKN